MTMLFEARRRCLTLGALFPLCFAPFVAVEAQTAAPSTRWVPAHSSNYSKRSSRSVRMIVIHTVEGSEGGCVSWFQNPAANVSAHYVVAHSGRVTQMVQDRDVAWHVAGYNSSSIGIENEGYAHTNTWTSAQMSKLAQLTAYLCERYGIPKDRSGIRSHAELDPSRRSDPGPYFDWNGFLTMVRGGSAPVARAPTVSAAPSAPARNASSGFGVEVTASALRVRASVWGTVLGSVRSGQRFCVRSQRSGWYEIDWGSRRAWIYAGYTRRITGQAGRVRASALNVRTGPSTGYRRIGTALNGQSFVLSGASGSWWALQFDDRAGWFHGAWVERLDLR